MKRPEDLQASGQVTRQRVFKMQKFNQFKEKLKDRRGVGVP